MTDPLASHLGQHLTVKQVCERLSVSKTLVYRMVAEGMIPSTRLGRRVLIPEAAIARLLAVQTVPVVEEAPPEPEVEAPQHTPRSSTTPRGRHVPRIELW